MKKFTQNRNCDTKDEIWLVQHPSVFTQGQAGKREHLHNPHDIPIVQTDRGGQITYHAIGQAVIYPLIDINRAKVGVRDFVSLLERSAVSLFDSYDIGAYANPSAPGVYIDINKTAHKIASLGIRVRRGKTYHGIAINVSMDLQPFSFINPCGLVGMKVTQCHDLNMNETVVEIQNKFVSNFLTNL